MPVAWCDTVLVPECRAVRHDGANGAAGCGFTGCALSFCSSSSPFSDASRKWALEGCLFLITTKALVPRESSSLLVEPKKGTNHSGAGARLEGDSRPCMQGVRRTPCQGSETVRQDLGGL